MYIQEVSQVRMGIVSILVGEMVVVQVITGLVTRIMHQVEALQISA